MAKGRLNGEGNIRLRDDGRYEIRVSGIDMATGKPKRISQYAKTEEEAIQVLRKLSLTVGKNSEIHSQNVTLEEWLDLWMELYMKNTIKQSTRMSYETYAKRHFNPVLGQMKLVEITPQMLQSFYNYKLEVEHLSPKTISNMNLYLHKALDQAYKEKIIPANPASALSLPRPKRPEIEILTRDEQAALVSASYTDRYGVFIRLVLVTGLRLDELLGLMWEDIDLRKNMLHVKRALNRLQIPGLPDDYQGPRTQIVIQEPKSENSIRSIPLLPAVVHDLLCWKQTQDSDKMMAEGEYQNTGLIVTNPLGGHIEPRTFSDYYHRILDKAGLRHFTFHALRHTFASRAMEQGMDEKTLSTLLGHYSVAFTMDTYTHVLDDHKWQGMQLMEELYNINQTLPTQQNYPIILTPDNVGGYIVTAPDFKQVNFYAPTMEEGIANAPETLRSAILSMVYPPPATELSTISTQPGQFALQIAL